MRRYRNRKDTNQSEIVAGLRQAGCEVLVMDQPCDLAVKTPHSSEPTWIDIKTLEGKRTPKQKAFDAMFPFTIHYWRTLTECLIGLGLVTPSYNYRVYPYDELVCVELTQIADQDIIKILTLIRQQKGCGQMSGVSRGSVEIWPKKGCKVKPLAERIDRALDKRRIEAL